MVQNGTNYLSRMRLLRHPAAAGHDGQRLGENTPFPSQASARQPEAAKEVAQMGAVFVCKG